MPQLAGVSTPSPPEVGDDAELRPQLLDRVAATVGVEVSDEVIGVRAHRSHHDARAGGGAQFGKAPCEMAVALGPQLDAVEPGAPREVELRAQVVAGQQLLLAGELHQADRLPVGRS